tara:strand:+ start:83 stop:466 length:384 start_codon:yes stop_codon:yes gene_type:complete
MQKQINNVFDLINNIAFDSHVVDINIADSQLFSPYITNRYLTFVDPRINHLINNTVNKYGIAFNSLDHYKFLFHLIPKTKRKFIRYIKKKKKNKIVLERIANQLEISQREVDLYSKNFKINTKKYEQ